MNSDSSQKQNSKPVPKKAKAEAPDSSNLFHPGQTLGGRYQVISCLGKGGMGVVYHVNQVFVNKEMALKTMEQHGMSNIAMRRFQKEARTAFAVQHPNVVAVNDFGVLDDQTPFLVMELIKGETLGERQRRTTCLPVHEAIPIFVQICFGLDYAHNLGVVHRDIKPSNIMILDDIPTGTEGSVKIVDFGIAKFAAVEGEEKQSLTRTGEIFGSPLYMSPEQCAGGSVDHRTDIYSLGCVLFESLTGTPPFIGENALATMIKHQNETPPTLKEASLGKEFPIDLEHIVATMLAKSPESRYQNLGIAAHDLAATMRGDAIIKPIAAQTKTSSSLSKNISMSRFMFYGSLLITALLSASLAGLARYNIKSNHLEKSIVASVPVKSKDRIKREQSTLPVNDEDIDKVQILAPQKLTERLAKKDPDGHLALHFKHITQECFKLIGNAHWIRFLDLEESDFDNRDLAWLQKLPLYYLCLKGTNLNDEGAAALSQLKTLIAFAATGTNLTNDGMSKLAQIKSLEQLDITSTKVSDEGLKAIGKLPKLRNLILKDDQGITDKGLLTLRNCPLQSVDLSHTSADDSSLKALSQIPTLCTVTLTGTQVTLAGLTDLCSHKNILNVDVYKCREISLKDIATLKAKAPWVIVNDKPEPLAKNSEYE